MWRHVKQRLLDRWLALLNQSLMKTTRSQHWLHYYAVLTAVVALLPISMGALVTTLGAGMAFLDWPTSDGWFILAYPWLQDFRTQPDKFVEHGHRLSAVLIGMFTTGLCIWTWRVEPRRWVRAFSAGIFLAVVGQGLLGGFRVIQDSRISALVHGQCASLIFSMISLCALVTSQRWSRVVDEPSSSSASGSGLRFVTLAVPIVLLGQSVIGSLVRHLGMGLDEHLVGAILATAVTVLAIVAAWRTGHRWLRSASVGLFTVLLFQLFLGAAAWVTKFGFPPAGYVAVQQAQEQILFRTAHAVMAMMVLMMSIQLAVRVARLSWLARRGGCVSHPSPTEFSAVSTLIGFTGHLEAFPTGGLR